MSLADCLRQAGIDSQDADAINAHVQGGMSAEDAIQTHLEEIGFELDDIAAGVREAGGGVAMDAPDVTLEQARRSDIGHKREAATGRYVGAPEWVGGSPQKLASLRKKLRQLASEGEPGRRWYENSSQAILAMAGGNVGEAEKIVSLIAIYSPNATVPANTTMALTAYYQWKAGAPIDAGFGVADNKAEDLLRKGKPWSGIKTNSFYQNLMVEIDPSKLEEGVATMDMWMAISFDYGMKTLDQGPKYKFSEREIQRLAVELGWKPHQVQAAIWTAMKARVGPIRPDLKEKELKLGIGELIEKDGKEIYRVKPDKKKEHFHLAHKMGMAYDLLQEDVIASKYDFSNALNDRAAQMSWEATPSVNVPDVAFIHGAPIGAKFRYLEMVQEALTGDKGQDLISEMLDLGDTPHLFGISAWEGEIGAGVQDFIPVPTKGYGKNKEVKPEAREMLDLYSAVRGLVLRQDMVVWHLPIYDDAKIRHNGFEALTKQSLTENEMRILYQAFHDKFGTWDLAPGYLDHGIRVLNFTEDLSNKEFQKGAEEIMKSLSDDFAGGKTHVAGYRSDGEAIDNDWKENPNGESYTKRIEAQRPDLLERIAGLRARVEEANVKFEEEMATDGHLYQEDEVDRDAVLREGIGGDGRAFTDFFSQVTQGLVGKSTTGAEYVPTVTSAAEAFKDPGSPLSQFTSEYNKHRGKFDDHIAFSIPGFAEVQQMVGGAISRVYGKDATMLDIGASEGSLVKTVTSRSKMRTVALDPNFAMEEQFEKSPVHGSKYVTQAFGSAEQEGQPAWTEEETVTDPDGNEVPNKYAGKQVKYYNPKGQKFDVVHEAMVFQFISPDRDLQIARAKELMKPDGVLIVEEKVHAEDSLVWGENEAKKNKHKLKYFEPEALSKKATEVLEGMNENMVLGTELEQVLAGNFRHVTQFWDSGNFKGWVASDNPAAVQNLVTEVGDTSSAYSTTETPRSASTELFQAAGPFYSELTAQVEAIKQNKAPPAQWLATLKKLTQKGVKLEEIKWSGVEQWLGEQGKSVTKEDLVAYLRSQEVVVEEVVKGSIEGADAEKDAVAQDEFGSTYAELSSGDRIFVDEAVGDDIDRGGDTKFSEYQMEGEKQGYRELVMTLPDEQRAGSFTIERQNGYIAAVDQTGAILFRQRDEVGNTENVEYQVRQMAEEKIKSIDPITTDAYKSGHWDEPNVVAHIRFNERTIDGKRTMMLEEVQSDWAQEGRRTGYAKPKATIEDIVVKAPHTTERSYDKFTAWANGVVIAMGDSAEKARVNAEKVLPTLDDPRLIGVPDQPFKKTETWAMLGMKRAIRWAAENGFEQVAWAPGEVQAARYDLSKHLDSVNARLKPDGRYDVTGVQVDGESHSFGIFEKEELSEAVGKDLAEKITTDVTETHQRKEYSGLDLKVGGEGMIGFYDKILPKAVGKYIKKFGAKVGVSEVERIEHHYDTDVIYMHDTVADIWNIEDAQGNTLGAFRTEEEAKNYVKSVNDPDIKTQEVWTFPITDSMRESAKAGQPLFQEKDKGPRAAIDLVSDNERLIKLKEASDLSSFLHEAGHLFLDMERVFAEKYGLTEDQETILDFLGIQSFDVLKPETEGWVELHEKWAETFEVYLRTGKAPSKGLEAAFDAFKSWLKRVYESLQDDRIRRAKLTPEITEVFDRLLATESEIAGVLADPAYEQFFRSKEQVGMTDAEWEKWKKKYDKQKDKAKRKAEASLDAKLLSELHKRKQKAWNEEKAPLIDEEKARLANQVEYKILADIKTYPLDYNAVKELLGAVPMSLLRSTKKGGTDPAEYADAYEYPTTQSMLETLQDTPTLNKAAEANAEQIMLAKYGDIMNDGTIEAEAREAVHNEEQAKLLLMELKAINKKAKQPAIDRDQLKRGAKAMIASMTFKEIQPGKYYRAENRAVAKAAKATTPEETLEAKTQQLVNHYLYKEAVEAKRKAQAIRKRLKGVQDRKYNPRQVHPEYVHQLKMLVAAYDLHNPTIRDKDKALAELQKVANWAQSQIHEDLGEGPKAHLYDPTLVRIMEAQKTGTLDQVTLRGWDEMTMEDLLGLDAMASHLRSRGGKLSEEGRKEFLIHAETVADSMRKNAPHGPEAKRKASWGARLRKNVQGYGSSVFMHADSVLRRLDGYANGAMYRAIKRPIDDAVTMKLLPAEEKAGEEMAAIYAEHYDKKELKEMNREDDVMGVSLSKWEMISMVLNLGNASSREAILASTIDGQQPFTEEVITEVLDRMDKRDMDFVQAVWDYNEQFKKPLFELERRIEGTAPPAIEAVPLVTKHGTYRGGYYPLSYDPNKSWRIKQHDANDMLESMTVGQAAKAHTKDGMVQARVGSGGNPVDLNMMVWHRHINDVLRRIHLTEAVNQAQGILSSRAVRDAANETNNQDFIMALDVWLKDAAAGELIGADVTSRILRNIRTGFSASAIGWNFGTMLLQPLGLFQSMPVIGYKNVMKGVIALSVEPFGENSAIKKVQAMSAFMRERGTTFNKDIKDTLTKMHGDPTKPTFYPDWFRESLFAGIVFTQRYVDVATWLGAYEAAKSETDVEADWIHSADRAVARSQASGIWSDRTPIERGSTSPTMRQQEFVRIWTALGSYFFAKGNVAVELFGKTNFRNPKQFVKFGTDMMCLFVLEATLVGLLRGTWPDDDDEESAAKFVAKESALATMASFPLLREIGSEISGFRGGSTLATFYETIGKAGTQISQGELDMALFRAINKVGGTVLKYPAGAINRAISATVEQVQGEDVRMTDYLIWRKKD